MIPAATMEGGQGQTTNATAAPLQYHEVACKTCGMPVLYLRTRGWVHGGEKPENAGCANAVPERGWRIKYQQLKKRDAVWHWRHGAGVIVEIGGGKETAWVDFRDGMLRRVNAWELRLKEG